MKEDSFMSVYGIYFSGTNQTKKVVDHIVTTITSHPNFYNLGKSDLTPITFDQDDLCIIGVPSYGGRVPSIALERLQLFKGNKTPAITITTYGNRHYDDTLIELNDLMTSLNFIVIGAIAAIGEHSIVHEFAYQRPNSNDYKELTQYSLLLKEKWLNKNYSTIHVPGNRPYRDHPKIIVHTLLKDTCHQCGLCAKECPVNAIDEKQFDKIDLERCVSCMHCVSVCPNQSRIIDPQEIEHTRNKIAKQCETEKENELFI